MALYWENYQEPADFTQPSNFFLKAINSNEANKETKSKEKQIKEELGDPLKYKILFLENCIDNSNWYLQSTFYILGNILHILQILTPLTLLALCTISPISTPFLEMRKLRHDSSKAAQLASSGTEI